MDANPLLLVRVLSSVRKARERTKRSMSRRKDFERKLAKQRMMMAFLVCSALMNSSVPRTLWQKERAAYWWEQIVNGSFTAVSVISACIGAPCAMNCEVRYQRLTQT